MPYLLLVLGLLAALYAFYLFLIKATTKDVQSLGRVAAAVIFGVVLLYLAMTRHLLFALGLFAIFIPFILSYLKGKKTLSHTDECDDRSDDQNDNKDA